MSEPAGKPWILTGSLENFRINVERGFDLIGFKERRRRQAEEFEPGDEVFFYVTGVQAFGGVARVRSEMFEDRTPVWPQYKRRPQTPPPHQRPQTPPPHQRPQESPPNTPEPYPWRVRAEPVLVLAEEEFVPAAELVPELEHVRKWPPEHWHLAFQGQLRRIGEADAALLRDRLSSKAAVRA